MSHPIAIELADRNKTFLHFYSTGSTLEEIGNAFGLTRERVRQILTRYGSPSRLVSPVDPIRSLYVCRRAMGITQAAGALGVEVAHLRVLLSELGVLPALERLWQWRRARRDRTTSNAELLERLSALVQALGRAPTLREIKEQLGIDPPTFYRRFGSFRAACALVGVAPRSRGYPGHLHPLRHPQQKARGHCRRGHDLTVPGSVYVYSTPTGGFVRYCKACQRLRREMARGASA